MALFKFYFGQFNIQFGCSVRVFNLKFYLGSGPIQILRGLLVIKIEHPMFSSIHASKQYHYDLLGKIFHSVMSFFDITPLGRVLNRIGNDISNIDDALPGSLESTFGVTAHVLCSMIVVMSVIPSFTLVLIPFLVVLYLVQRFFVGSQRCVINRYDSYES